MANKRTWKPCFSVDGVHLPTGYYFGVSAATGDLSDNHDVTGLKTYELDSPEPTDERADILPNADQVTSPRDHTDDPPPSMSGFKKFLLFIVVVIGERQSSSSSVCKSLPQESLSASWSG